MRPQIIIQANMLHIHVIKSAKETSHLFRRKSILRNIQLTQNTINIDIFIKSPPSNLEIPGSRNLSQNHVRHNR